MNAHPPADDIVDVVVIAEAGVNHNGDLTEAHRLVDIAADAGADAIKFQTFVPENLVSQAAASTPYQLARAGNTSQADMLRALALPREAWAELQQHSSERGVDFLSTPFDLDSAALLRDLGVKALKIGSGELTNLPFLRAVSDLGVPLIVSTGMGSLDEVSSAVDSCQAAPSLSLLHCVSAYPAPADECNLLAIPAMSRRFGVPVGWSDHTLGLGASIAAVAVGARLLEKHFTSDKTLPGPDHAASLEPEELTEYVAAVRDVPRALGDGTKRRMPSEEENAPLVRRSWHAVRDLRAGQTLTADDVMLLRPEGGVAPDRDVVGLRLRTDVEAGSLLSHSAVEDAR